MGPSTGRFAGSLARLLLPKATAQASCPETWYEYYTTACGDCTPLKCRKRRFCKWCNGKITCGPWRTWRCIS
jgi:hypothetical protein